MTPPTSVSIETAIFSCVITFLVGFFGNLLAMRRMFPSKTEFDTYRVEHEKDTDEMKKRHDQSVVALKADQERVATDLRQKHEKETIEAKKTMLDLCDSRRAACLPMVNSITRMQTDISELFKLIREGHGKIERLIGLMEHRMNGETKQ